MAPRGAYKVLVDNYVTDDAGTGIVQQAPYFGEVIFKNVIYLKTVAVLTTSSSE